MRQSTVAREKKKKHQISPLKPIELRFTQANFRCFSGRISGAASPTGFSLHKPPNLGKTISDKLISNGFVIFGVIAFCIPWSHLDAPNLEPQMSCPCHAEVGAFESLAPNPNLHLQSRHPLSCPNAVNPVKWIFWLSKLKYTQKMNLNWIFEEEPLRCSDGFDPFQPTMNVKLFWKLCCIFVYCTMFAYFPPFAGYFGIFEVSCHV